MKISFLKRILGRGGRRLRREHEHDSQYSGRCWQLFWAHRPDDYCILIWEDDIYE
jgi:hypothetical protein